MFSSTKCDCIEMKFSSQQKCDGTEMKKKIPLHMQFVSRLVKFFLMKIFASFILIKENQRGKMKGQKP